MSSSGDGKHVTLCHHLTALRSTVNTVQNVFIYFYSLLLESHLMFTISAIIYIKKTVWYLITVLLFEREKSLKP